MKATYNKAVLAARNIMHETARADGVSYEEVYEGFQNVILHGLASTEPDTMRFWSEVKLRAKKEVPTPEDVLIHISCISNRESNSSYPPIRLARSLLH